MSNDCYFLKLYNKQERESHHFHFSEWLDHGVPDSVKLVKFYRKVKSKICDVNGAMVVHCRYILIRHAVIPNFYG